MAEVGSLVAWDDEIPFETIDGAAIAICAVNGRQRHLGVLHKGNGNAVLFLHLAWHYCFKNEEPSPDLLCIRPRLPSRRLLQVADVCRLIWRSNEQGKIPYGFSSPTNCFDERTYEYSLGPTGTGLTCASFVLAVFERAGMPLVDYQQWPVGRPDDLEWQEQIILLLSQRSGTAEHVSALRNDIGAVRFRPEEVAAAAICDVIPAGFLEAEEASSIIINKLYAE